jgi:heat shock protein HslJ
MRRTMFVIVTALAASVACENNPTSPSDVVAHNWQLVSFETEGSGLVMVQDPSRYTLRLEEDGRASVKSDCNSCGGTYTLTGTTLELGGIACTKVACGDDSLDPTYARALEGPKTVSVDDSQLTVRGAGITLHFRN